MSINAIFSTINDKLDDTLKKLEDIMLSKLFLLAYAVTTIVFAYFDVFNLQGLKTEPVSFATILFEYGITAFCLYMASMFLLLMLDDPQEE